MKSEVKKTSDAASGNSYIALTVQALDAPYKGQDNIIMLNLYNSKASAVQVARAQLSSIMHVTGRMSITDTDQLIGQPFITVWERRTSKIMDRETGQERFYEGCQVRDYQFIDGKTIKEASTGAAASNPYIPGVTGVQEAAQRGSQPTHTAKPAAPPAAATPPGFQAPGGVPSTAGAAPQGFAQAPAGFQQPPAQQQAIGTAQSGFSGQPPQQGGFGPPQGGAPGGFGQPAQGQPPAQGQWPAQGQQQQPGGNGGFGPPTGGFGPR